MGGNRLNKHHTNKQERIVLLGGSFDPIHFGHLQMAQCAQTHCQASGVWFVPVGCAWQKQRPLTNSQHRLNMLGLAINHTDPINQPRNGNHRAAKNTNAKNINPEYANNWSINTFELEHEGPSYTIDTLSHYKLQYPNTEFIWIIGLDQALNLSTWKQWQELFDYAKIGVLNRPLETAIQSTAPKIPQAKYQTLHQILPKILLPWIDQQALFHIPMPDMSIASTHIRAYIEQWHHPNPKFAEPAYRQLCQWTPQTVLKYIKAHKLYEYNNPPK